MASQTNAFTIPKTMKAWVLGGPDELSLVEKPVPEPGRAEVLVRIDAIAVCATDIEIIKHGLPAIIDGGSPFNKGFTPGHEYMGTVVKLGPTVDEFELGDRITVEVHAGWPQPPVLTPVECPARVAMSYTILSGRVASPLTPGGRKSRLRA